MVQGLVQVTVHRAAELLTLQPLHPRWVVPLLGPQQAVAPHTGHGVVVVVVVVVVAVAASLYLML